MVRYRDSLRDSERNNAPMVEIFGGVFALLLTLFLMINLFSQMSLQERLDNINEGGKYKVSWGAQGRGYTLVTFPSELRIVETGETVKYDGVCKPNSPFVAYTKKIYGQPKQQLIFTITEGSVAMMAKARNCVMQILPNRHITIGWIIADRELLKSVNLDDIPPYIKDVIDRRPLQ